MGCNKSENVNFSDNSYEAKMTTYISNKMRRRSKNKIIWISKSSRHSSQNLTQRQITASVITTRT